MLYVNSNEVYGCVTDSILHLVTEAAMAREHFLRRRRAADATKGPRRNRGEKPSEF